MPSASKRHPGWGLIASIWAYFCTFAMAIWASVEMPPGSVRTALILTPTLTGILVLSTAYWLYKASDEFIRLKTLQAAASTAFVLAILVLIYCYLELLGLPKLSMAWVHNIGWAIFVSQMLLLKFRSR